MFPVAVFTSVPKVFYIQSIENDDRYRAVLEESEA
jgi:hypothetical protein